ncbi:MAG: glycosyltransferase family 2 protein [Candidatus Competibacterales bacterium]|nr:glycosyltransferase family 2 protein [Candidatus Competibacterales bacterium]
MHLSIVVPCYNEEAVLAQTVERLLAVLEGLSRRGLIDAGDLWLVDDGSTDRTWALIREAATCDARVHGIKLSRNFGHQHALLAGLLTAPGDALVSIDADLQDDVAAIGPMVEAWRAGHDVVYGVREDRSADTAWKRLSAELYYRLLHLLGVRTVFNHADYRLLSRRALEALRGFREVNLFLRGLVPQLGFRSTCVHYPRRSRQAGESKYPARKMFSLALEGITSFSGAPLRLITLLGVLVFLASGGLALWALWVALFTDRAVPGWASTVVPMYFLGGVQLLGIGVIGEYLRKLYLEVKARPRYLIEEQC